MALPLESTPAGRWILHRCAGLALLLLTMAMDLSAKRGMEIRLPLELDEFYK